MIKTAFIFPGQGSQSEQMGKSFYDNFNVSKNIFEIADNILEKNISKLCFEGTAEDLKQTINTQPCLLTTEIAGLEALKSFGVEAQYCAGHSLGEYAALYYAGVLDLKSVLKIVNKRADLMASVQDGIMSAVLGLDDKTVLECVEDAKKYGKIGVANYNCKGQVVITGENIAIEKASEILKEKGAKRVIQLPVSGAFHSELMKPVSVNFGKYIENFEINDAKVNVITNVDYKIEIKKENFRKKMPEQMYSSVFWTQSIEEMIKNGVETFVEIGAGKVLSGLNKKINSEIKTYNVFDADSLKDTLAQIKG